MLDSNKFVMIWGEGYGVNDYPATTTISGDLTNEGNIWLTAIYRLPANPSLNFGGDSTLRIDGGTLTNAPGAYLRSWEGNPNFPGRRFLEGNLDNQGTFVVSHTTLFTKSEAHYDNSGVFRLEQDASLTIDNEGSFMNLPGGQFGGIGLVELQDGSTFENQGTVTPGLSPGILSFTGVYNQSAQGELAIEIGGMLVGDEYDQLAVSSAANIDGLLSVKLLNDFVPQATDVFTVLTANNINGMFCNAIDSLTLLGRGVFDVTYNSGSVQLSNFQAVPEPSGLVLGAFAALCFARLSFWKVATNRSYSCNANCSALPGA